MPAKFSPAPEVERIARTLIREHHRHLDADGVRIEYAFVDKAPNAGGKTRLGMAKKVAGLDLFLLDHEGPMFVIVISQDTWGHLTREQRVALVDHELMHCDLEEDRDGEPKAVIRPHDVTEFRAVVDRHGLYLEDLERFASAVAKYTPQLGLPMDLPAETRAAEGHARGLTHA